MNYKKHSEAIEAVCKDIRFKLAGLQEGVNILEAVLPTEEFKIIEFATDLKINVMLRKSYKIGAKVLLDNYIKTVCKERSLDDKYIIKLMGIKDKFTALEEQI